MGSERFAKFKDAAEKALGSGMKDPVGIRQSIDTMFQELQEYQVELEMQNDELRIANEELEIQRMKFAGIYDNAPVGYFILNSADIIEELNTAGINLLEARREQIVGRRMLSFVSPQFSDTYHGFFNRLLSSPAKHTCQLKMITPFGRELYVQMEGIALKAASQCYITVIDITESLYAKWHLAETKDRLALALTASSTGTWELNPTTMQVYLDEFARKLLRLTKARYDESFSSFIALAHPDDQVLLDQHFRTAINTYKEINVTCRFITGRDNTCYINIRGHRIEKGEEEDCCFIGIMMDITRKKQAEEESNRQKEKQQKAVTAARLAAEENERKRISGNLHDSVGQLLYAAKMQVSQLQDLKDPASLNKLHDLLNIAIRETRNISFELAPSILTDFGLPDTVAELTHRLSSPNLKIEAKISGFHQRLDILAETSIFRIIQELLNNCMKHAEANLIQITLKRNKSVEITVMDNGKGFDVKQLESKCQGTGFSSIKNRINLYGGSIHIDSVIGQGTIIRVTLNC